jgi:hypothetical protein
MHYVLTDDDAIPYCSDTCARTDPRYAGWYGAQEGTDSTEYCASCGVRCSIGLSSGCTWVCVPLVVAVIMDYTADHCAHGLPMAVAVSTRS